MRGAGSAAGGGTAKPRSPNAIYDQLKVELVDAEGQVAAAQRRLAEAEADAGPDRDKSRSRLRPSSPRPRISTATTAC